MDSNLESRFPNAPRGQLQRFLVANKNDVNKAAEAYQ